jgi:hypothetical protein
VQTDEGATDFLQGDQGSDWAAKIFDTHKREAIEKIAGYSEPSDGDHVTKINAIANEAEKVVKQHLPANAGIKDVKIFFSNQANDILLYLPADLHMGELLNDETLDDKTNKMEGPVSSLIKSIGNAFSNPVTNEEVKKP